jgi:hypothetical protein
MLSGESPLRDSTVSSQPFNLFCGNRPAKFLLFGAVAQLGERLICIQEVIGSIPFSSTNFSLDREGMSGGPLPLVRA